MPKVDGIEVLRTMRSDPHLKFIPVVVMTSSREDQDVLKSYSPPSDPVLYRVPFAPLGTILCKYFPVAPLGR